MKVYIRYLIYNFLRSFIYVSLVFLSLVLILNILTEIEFFKNLDVKTYFPIYVSLLNSPSLLFEMFPFIFLISTQFFFINIFNDNQIQIFKYSGLKNSVILFVISLSSLIIGFLLITLFYSFSSNLKNLYLEIKNKYTTDDKYLAVITNNGLWIKDTHEGLTNIIHASSMNEGLLVDTFISQFDNRYEVIRHIYSDKININNNNWVIYDAKIYENGTSEKKEKLEIFSNFDYQKIQSLFSNLSSLSLMELIELKKNYKSLNYSTTEVDLQIQKVVSYPMYLVLMTILSSIIMFNTKNFTSNTIKISIGFFLSVIIYYINNFFMVMGKTEKINLLLSIWMPLLFLLIINSIISYKLNEK
jgi:lipopolysaccharide export system permease protein